MNRKEREYENRVRYYQRRGCTRGDAQGVVDAEDIKAILLADNDFVSPKQIDAAERRRDRLYGRGENYAERRARIEAAAKVAGTPEAIAYQQAKMRDPIPDLEE